MHTVPRARLAACAHESEVVAVVRDYLSQWTPAELASLPEKCRPGRIRDGEDIADCAYELTKARIAAGGRDDLLVELETFFAQACRRLSLLDGGPQQTQRTGASGGSND